MRQRHNPDTSTPRCRRTPHHAQEASGQSRQGHDGGVWGSQRASSRKDKKLDLSHARKRCYPNVRAPNRAGDISMPGCRITLVVRLWCVTEAAVMKRCLARVVCLAHGHHVVLVVAAWPIRSESVDVVDLGCYLSSPLWQGCALRALTHGVALEVSLAYSRPACVVGVGVSLWSACL